MALLVSSRRRRSGAVKEATAQFIVFQLRQESCALPIAAVEKVTVLGQVYGDPKQQGLGVTTYEGRELVVVDVGKLVFGEAQGKTMPDDLASASAARFLLVVTDEVGNSVGLPVDSAPSVRRVPQSAIAPVPSAYSGQGSLQCVSSLAVKVEGESPFFVLDAKRLCQPLELT